MTSPSNDDPIVGINIIPLVDIALVLLIIFMVSSTLLLSPSIRLDLPKAKTGQPGTTGSIHVAIGPDGALQVDGQPVTEEEMTVLFQQKAKESPSLLLHADKAATHGLVIRVIDLARAVGINRFAFMVESEKP